MHSKCKIARGVKHPGKSAYSNGTRGKVRASFLRENYGELCPYKHKDEFASLNQGTDRQGLKATSV